MRVKYFRKVGDTDSDALTTCSRPTGQQRQSSEALLSWSFPKKRRPDTGRAVKTKTNGQSLPKNSSSVRPLGG